MRLLVFIPNFLGYVEDFLLDVNLEDALNEEYSNNANKLTNSGVVSSVSTHINKSAVNSSDSSANDTVSENSISTIKDESGGHQDDEA